MCAEKLLVLCVRAVCRVLQVAELGGTVPAEILTNVAWLAQLRAANLAAAGVQAGADNATA
jgi:hypothetical protein